MRQAAGFWLHAHPLVLASGSLARRALLTAAGIPPEIATADLDERRVEAELANLHPSAVEIAGALARAKAGKVASNFTDRVVVGCDQILSLGNRVYHKPADMAQAHLQLAELSGATHQLCSAASVWLDGREVFACTCVASLTMRELTAEFIQQYIDASHPDTLLTVGCYQIEGLGIHLFEQVQGDQATILGLPLFPLLKFFRENGFLAG